EGGFLRNGKLPRASRALIADAFGTMFGALTGTSTVTSYIESAAGVAAGARTGLGNVVIAALFLVAMFCAPLVAAIPAYATAPALILVGALMCGAVARVKWDDLDRKSTRLNSSHVKISYAVFCLKKKKKKKNN